MDYHTTTTDDSGAITSASLVWLSLNSKIGRGPGIGTRGLTVPNHTVGNPYSEQLARPEWVRFSDESLQRLLHGWMALDALASEQTGRHVVQRQGAGNS